MIPYLGVIILRLFATRLPVISAFYVTSLGFSLGLFFFSTLYHTFFPYLTIVTMCGLFALKRKAIGLKHFKTLHAELSFTSIGIILLLLPVKNLVYELSLLYLENSLGPNHIQIRIFTITYTYLSNLLFHSNFSL